MFNDIEDLKVKVNYQDKFTSTMIEDVVEDYFDYTLVEIINSNDEFAYKVYDPSDVCIATWHSNIDAMALPMSDYKKSKIRSTFLDCVSKDEDKYVARKAEDEEEDEYWDNRYEKQLSLDSIDDDASTYWWNDDKTKPVKGSFASSSFAKSYANINIDDYTKSDTLVIHCSDRTTDMLSQIYANRNWDVLRNGNINRTVLIELIKAHDRIIMLGHGSPNGLFNIQGGGYVIESSMVPYLSGKKLFAIWCYAATFFKRNGLHGYVVTDNCPSEVWEVSAAGIHDKVYTPEYVLENITYYCGLFADIIDQALDGDKQGAIDYVRRKYIEKFGHDGMTDFNANTLQIS